MRIGEVAAAAGLPTQTIRFYERKGLLPPPRRGPNGYRVYDPPTLTRLRFIRSVQGAGLTLVEIATILKLRGEGVTPCTHVRELLSTKLHDVQVRQRELSALETELTGLISRSHRLDPADCTDAQICNIIAPPHRVLGRDHRRVPGVA
ncbi:MAG: heavy metal-responsive transcriptional regulator [Knoellia sp.]